MTHNTVTPQRAALGAIILSLGFYITTNYINPIFSLFAPYSLMIAGLIAFAVAFGPSSVKGLFQRPADPKGNVHNFFTYIVLTAVLGMSAAILLQYIFKFHLTSNPISGDISSIVAQIPFMLLGEELISFYILLTIANLVYKKTQNQEQAELVGMIFSCVIFGLLHFSTYYSGNLMTTLAHILLIQGSARIAFNLSGLKSNSLIMPLVIHIAYDLVVLSVV